MSNEAAAKPDVCTLCKGKGWYFGEGNVPNVICDCGAHKPRVVKAHQIDSNRALCPVCKRMVKVTKGGSLADHGFQRPGAMRIQTRGCPGR
jgi:hypothetical protein